MATFQTFHELTEEAMIAMAKAVSDRLQPGDTVLLQGDLGAGKTSFARAAILRRMAKHDLIEDVPSPTFTLVQTYELPDATIHHADLYRLSDSSELIELGLLDGEEHSIAFIEWPERLGADAPEDALTIAFGINGDARDVTFSSRDPNWESRMSGIAA
ncbi:MAG: tRNA (adenosine(37)-N6)-threonylcarbamoyltransferase complex ATPase subunit type 1 TsaE [Pseudomonadota bacterium]